MSIDGTDRPQASLLPEDSTVELLPDFELPASTGKRLGLDSFRGKVNMALVFLDLSEPSDLEVLQAIDGRLKEFGENRSQVLPIVQATDSEVRRIADEHDLAVPLLADESGEIEHSITTRPSPSEVAVVADKEGTIVKRIAFGEFDSEDFVDQLLDIVGGLHNGGSDEPADQPSSLYGRIAAGAHVPDEEAPILVRAFLQAVAPFADDREALSALAPRGMSVPEAMPADGALGVEDLLAEALAETSLADGRAAEYLRVVAEALASEAGPDQLERLRESITDDDVLALFESERGELTATEPDIDTDDISGGESPRFQE